MSPPRPPAPCSTDDEVRDTHTVVLGTDSSGHRTVNHYRLLSELGRGVHGSVRKAQHTATGSAVAIKIVDRATRRRWAGDDVQRRIPTSRPPSQPLAPRATDDKVLRELAILRKCSSPYIVRLLEVIDDPQSKKIFMGAFCSSTADPAPLCQCSRLTRPADSHSHGVFVWRRGCLEGRMWPSALACRHGAPDWKRHCVWAAVSALQWHYPPRP